MRTKELRLLLEHLLECNADPQISFEAWDQRHSEVLEIVRNRINHMEAREARRELKTSLGYSRVGRDAMRRG